jgi:uncharacterized tellurite resistance protein B-like protein
MFSPPKYQEIVTQSYPTKSVFQPAASLLASSKYQSLGGDLPVDGVYFFGEKTSLDIGRGVLKDPLVYATGKRSVGSFDSSLIDGAVPVATPGTQCFDRLPYWPSYEGCSPEQRAVYLDWLLGGRKEPSIQIGYVFVFFYGLERRILVDRKDFEPVCQELVRLLKIYGPLSNSFRRYATKLLWTTIVLSADQGGITLDSLIKALTLTKPLDQEILPMYLAYLYQRDEHLPAGLAYVVAERDPRIVRSMLIKRHGKMFKELFKAKYTQQFGRSVKLQLSKQQSKMIYAPASATLARLSRDRAISLVIEFPNVMGISRQFTPLVEIWSECIDELRAFDKAQIASGGDHVTSAMYEALPPELRKGDHPEMESWSNLLKQYAHEDGKTVLPVSGLAQIKGMPIAQKLTKRQCLEILQTADMMGFGIEPDARLTGKNYEWNEQVGLFMLEDEDSQKDMTAYFAASILLRLGLSVAGADGDINPQELEHITQHLEKEFDLSINQTRRLEELRHLLLTTQSYGDTLGRALQKSLSLDQRRMVGRFLCGIAAIDEVITAEELKALKKLYRILDINPDEIQTFISPAGEKNDKDEPVEIQSATSSSLPGESIPPPPEIKPLSGFVLNMSAIKQIMSETQEVADILRSAMNVDTEPENITISEPSQNLSEGLEVKPFSEKVTGFIPVDDSSIASTDSLDPRFRVFYDSLITRSSWDKAELDTLARQQNLMLSGAIEAINEWSQEKFGDWLIEEGQFIEVRTDLLKG